MQASSFGLFHVLRPLWQLDRGYSSTAPVTCWVCPQLQFGYLPWIVIRWPWSVGHLLCRIHYLFQLRVGVKLLSLPECNLQLQSNAVFAKGCRSGVQVGIKPGKIIKLTFAQQAALDLGRHNDLKPDINFQSGLKRAGMPQNSAPSINRWQGVIVVFSWFFKVNIG